MNRRRLLILAQAVLLFLSGEQSAVTTAHGGESVELSTFLLHLDLPAAALEPPFNRLYAGDGAGRHGPQDWITLGGGTGFMRYQAARRHGELKLQANEILSQALIEFSVEYAKQSNEKTHKIADCGSGAAGSRPGRLEVMISSLLTSRRDYSFEPSSRVTSIESKQPCLLGSDQVDATPLMAQVYRSRLESMLPVLDRTIREAASFKSRMNDAWARLQAPIQLDDGATMWLVLSPLQTEAVEPVWRNGALSAEVGIVAAPRVILGKKPALPVRPLPSLGDRYSERGFHVPFTLDVPYDDANQRLRDVLVGREFGIGPGRVVVRRVKLYPLGRQAGVDIDVEGLIALGVKLRGTPVYDQTTETIGFTNVEYEMTEQNALTNFADELLHEAIRDELAARLKIPIRDSLEEMRRELESALNRDIEGGTLQGKVERIRLLDLGMGQKGLSAHFRTDGELRYDLR
jgi:hypothetical protein